MRVKRSYLFAGGIGVVVIGYFVVGSIMGGGHKKAEAAPKKADQAPLVRVAMVSETVRPYDVVLRGRTEATRTVQVKAETAGVVAATPVPEGSFVRAGQVLCRIDVDARQAALDQARAKFRAEQLEYQAAERLKERGFRSETQVLSAKAEMDQAAASVRQNEVLLDQVNVRAPFAGVFDNRDVEVGGYLSPGEPCGTVVELSPLLLVGDVSEQEAARLQVGAPARARLATGGLINGRVRYVSRDASPTTRTYRVEVVAPNPGSQIRSGLSAELSVQAGSGPAHLAPVSALVLDAEGRQGVRYVQGQNRVGFAPVRVLEETPEGVWVQGLTGQVRLITVGQSYVSEGQVVRVAAR
jgi:multidrug efflux system membrane fusion protein